LDQGIPAVAVVTTTDSCRSESQSGIESQSWPVTTFNLQGGASGSPLVGDAEQSSQHPLPQALSSPQRIHGHQRDVQLLEDQPAAGHGEQLPPLPQPQSRPPGFGQLPVPLTPAPQSPQTALIEVEAGVEVLAAQGAQHGCRIRCRPETARLGTSVHSNPYIQKRSGRPPPIVISCEPQVGSLPLETGRDIDSPNRNLAPLTTAVDRDGCLEVGGCRLSELARTFGTPLYVLDELTLRTTCGAYRRALEAHYPGPSLALYASKANSSLALTALVASEGLGLDAVSAGELLTALEGGMPPGRIVLHGNNKSSEELALAAEHGVTVVADNWRDLELLAALAPEFREPVRLMLRFTPGIECHTHEYIRTGHLDSKFGFDPDQLETVLRHLQGCDWSRVTGLHAHIGSQIFELQPHRDLAAVMADALKLARSLGHPVVDLNVGGGLGIRYVASDAPPSIEEWITAVADAVVAACRQRDLELPRLLCEPGRSLVATAGITLYTIGSRKEIPGIRTYVSVDGGMSDNPRPITYQSSYTALLADRPRAAATATVTVAGKHCESGDVLLKDIQLPAPVSGDVLVVLATGAYNASMGSNYNRIPRPAAVLVGNGQAELVQRREQPEDLLRYDVLPPRLQPVP
jgi:diaminopimelate decarboxylase